MYLKSFFNFLSRNKLYTSINIFGFAASLTFVLLVGLYVENEFSVDASQSKADRIVLLKNEDYHWPALIAADIEGRYPEVEATMRHDFGTMTIKKVGDNESSFGDVLQIDSTFFTMFDVDFIEGSAQTALVDLRSVVLSKSYANKMFGSESVLGQQIQIGNHKYTVSGVVDDFNNSLIRRFDCIVRMDAANEIYLTQYGYSACNFSLFILLKPGTSLAPKYVDMVEWFKTFFWLYSDGAVKMEVTTVPLRDAYWDESIMSSLRGNDRALVDILIACALAILLFAIINYINLSIAQTTLRAKQAAMRRLLGGTKIELFTSFIFESIILCTMSMMLAIIFASGLMGWFNSTMQTDLKLEWLLTPTNISVIVGMLITVGFISGVIPAYITTQFKPLSVVKGDFRRRSKMVFSKILIGVQYLITIVLIGCAVTIGRQTSFLINADLGFDRHQVIEMSNAIWSDNVWSTYSALNSVAGVEQVSLSQGSPIGQLNNNSFTRDGVNYSFSILSGDTVFMDLLDIEILSRTGVVDSGAVWINETGARKMGLKPTDVRMPMYETDYLPLKGIVRDIHFNSMDQKIGEMLIRPLYKQMPWNVLVKVSTGDLAATKDAVVAKYKQINGGLPVEAEFMDANVEQWYVKQRQTQSLVGVVSILAIIIAALGILAMSTYFIDQRRGEIAVRKVFGSSNANIFNKLTRQFLIIIAIAFVVAVPIIYYFMADWLKDFAYHIDLSWDIFVIAGLIAFAIAMTTISWKAYQAMTANPIKSLKSE